MSFRYGSGIVKPGFNPLTAKTPTYTYYLQTWGLNTNGELGINNTVDGQSSPIQVGSLTDWSSIDCGSNHTIATKTDGSLWSWGVNFEGRLGLGSGITNRSSPVQIGSNYNWSKAGGGGLSSFAIKTDGSMWAWGEGSAGELGLGDANDVSSPVQVRVLTTWSKLGPGYAHSLAIKTDGTLWAWGNNGQGGLGQNNKVYTSSPVQIGALTNWSKAVAGSQNSYAIKTDGTLWSWGANDVGNLGHNDIVDRSSPVQIGALTTWSDLASGVAHLIVTKTDGTLWAWGYNAVQAQLGDNTAINRSSPVQIGALTTWATPCSAEYHSYAITTSGALYAWGRNRKGQLGTNVTSYSVSSPVQVGSNTTWFFATGGLENSLALFY